MHLLLQLGGPSVLSIQHVAIDRRATRLYSSSGAPGLHDSFVSRTTPLAIARNTRIKALSIKSAELSFGAHVLRRRGLSRRFDRWRGVQSLLTQDDDVRLRRSESEGRFDVHHNQFGLPDASWQLSLSRDFTLQSCYCQLTQRQSE